MKGPHGEKMKVVIRLLRKTTLRAVGMLRFLCEKIFFKNT